MENFGSNLRLEEETSVTNRKQQPHRWTGYLFAIFAAFMSATGSLFYKMTNDNKLKVVLFRFMFQYLLLLPIITCKKIDMAGHDYKTNILLLLRGILSPLAMYFLGISLNYLSLGDTMAIFYIYPSLVAFLACLCLKEKCGILNLVLTLVTMLGFVLVAQPSFIFGTVTDDTDTHSNSNRLLGVLFALLASLSVATVAIVLRKLGSNVHVLLSMMYTAWEGPLFATVYLLASGESLLPCWNSFPFIVGCGVCYLLTQASQTLALQREKAGPVALVQSSQVVFSFVFQFIVFGEVPNTLCAIGAALILFSCIALGLKSFLNLKKNKDANE